MGLFGGRKTVFVDADILVIGGGMAGCGATYEARHWGRDLKIVCVEKANIERSGAVAQGLYAINCYMGMQWDENQPEDHVRYARNDLMGLVREDLGRPMGTAVGCGVMTSLAPYNFTAPAPFSMAFDLGKGRRNLTVSASGYCLVADQSFPIPGTPAPLLLVGCTLTVDPDPSQGIVRGTATSSSVFLPVAIPGFQTGSVWTLHLYTEAGAELDLEE